MVDGLDRHIRKRTMKHLAIGLSGAGRGSWWGDGRCHGGDGGCHGGDGRGYGGR
jgi:hypothetical protein